MTQVDQIVDHLYDLETVVYNEQTAADINKGINRVKFLDWSDRIEWKQYAAENNSWLPDWVIDDDGLVLRAARIMLLATGKDMQNVELKYGYSFIYKMEAKHRRPCERYCKEILDILKKMKEKRGL